MAETYKVDVKCSNCGFEGVVELPKGDVVMVAKCPTCGCTELHRR
jgi:predicted RNA-binding Zn-ribbon protein involved in translation (DUF1610 family)